MQQKLQVKRKKNKRNFTSYVRFIFHVTVLMFFKNYSPDCDSVDSKRVDDLRYGLLIMYFQYHGCAHYCINVNYEILCYKTWKKIVHLWNIHVQLFAVENIFVDLCTMKIFLSIYENIHVQLFAVENIFDYF